MAYIYDSQLKKKQGSFVSLFLMNPINFLKMQIQFTAKIWLYSMLLIKFWKQIKNVQKFNFVLVTFPFPQKL